MLLPLKFELSASEESSSLPALSRPNEKPSHPFHLVVWADIAAPLAQAPMVPSKEEKEANGPALIIIQDYNAFNRSPKGLTGWINHKHAFLCRKMHSSHTGGKKGKKRLIDREDETALSGGVGCMKGRKLGNERMSGRPKCYRGETKPWLQSQEKEKARISQDDGLKEGGRDED